MSLIWHYVNLPSDTLDKHSWFAVFLCLTGLCWRHLQSEGGDGRLGRDQIKHVLTYERLYSGCPLCLR